MDKLGASGNFGILADLMKDPLITEIMVNDLRNVLIEREGKLFFSGVTFKTLVELQRFTQGLLEGTGKVLDSDHPYIDLMLPDGSRVNIVDTPLTLHGPCITIRKFPAHRLSMDDLIQKDMLDKRMAHFLSACIVGKVNILISGGTNSGKTTLLNTFVQVVPKDERIVVIEDTPELLIQQINSVCLQVKPQTPTSPGVSARELVANSLRMRPDRIIVGECRRGEAFDMLQAMNTGHGGSMTTLHANTPRDALARLETLCLMGAVDLPLLAIRKQIQSAIQLVVQVRRFKGGKRRIISMSEITGMEGETLTMQDIFSAGATGSFKGSGLVPTFLSQLEEQGISLAKDYFS